METLRKTSTAINRGAETSRLIIGANEIQQTNYRDFAIAVGNIPRVLKYCR